MNLAAHLPRVLALVSLTLFAAESGAQLAPENLGTLFYTPAERTGIVAARVDQQAGGFNFDTSLSVTGLVKRGRAKGTAWINGQIVAEGQSVHSGAIPQIGDRSVAIDGQAVRVGETLDVESAARTDFIPPGAVSVRKQK
jgi:hypothetical protein